MVQFLTPLETHRGWQDPVGQFVRLQRCVRILIEGKDNFGRRMERASYALVTMLPEHFPERIRGRASKVLAVRSAVRQEFTNDYVRFEFERLKPKERTALIDDIMALYEACAMDCALGGWDVAVYPEDR